MSQDIWDLITSAGIITEWREPYPNADPRLYPPGWYFTFEVDGGRFMAMFPRAKRVLNYQGPHATREAALKEAIHYLTKELATRRITQRQVAEHMQEFMKRLEEKRVDE